MKIEGRKRATTATLVHTLLVVASVAGIAVASVAAQNSDPSTSARSLARIGAAVAQPQQIAIDGASLVAPPPTRDFRVGVLTFTPPDTPGQFIAISVPVGELVTRAAHSFAASRQHRARRAAHDQVVKALAEFQQSR